MLVLGVVAEELGCAVWFALGFSVLKKDVWSSVFLLVFNSGIS